MTYWSALRFGFNEELRIKLQLFVLNLLEREFCQREIALKKTAL
jgi:hypothetical protein